MSHFLLTLKCCNVSLQKRLRKRKSLPLYFPNSLTPSKPLSVTAPLLVPVFAFETPVTSIDSGGRSVQFASPLGQWSTVLLEWQISKAAPHCQGWVHDMASRSADTLGGSGGMSICDAHIHVPCVCMHLLPGNLSTLTDAINLNTRVDLALNKCRLF